MTTTLGALTLLGLAIGDAQACINDMEEHRQEVATEPVRVADTTPAQPAAELPEQDDDTRVLASVGGGAAGLGLLIALGVPLRQRRRARSWEELD